MIHKLDSVYHKDVFSGFSFRKEEQVRLLYMQAIVSNSVVIIISILYYFLLRSRLDSNLMTVWMLMLLLVSFYRLSLWYSQKNNAKKNSNSKWLNLYLLGCGMLGISWSLIYPSIIGTSDTIVLSSLLILAFGVMSSAVPVLSVCIPAFLLYTYPQGLTLFVTFILMNDVTYAWIAFAVVIYLLMLTFFALNTNRSILHSIKLQEHNRSLIEDLNKEINQREDLITQRTYELKQKNEDLLSEIKVRKNAEEELRNSERKFKSIFENAPLAITHIDKNGVVTACNDILCDIIGASTDKLIGFNTLKSIKDEHMRKAIKRALSGKTGRYQGEYLSVAGNIVTPINCKFGPIFSSERAVIGAIGLLEDISAQNAVKKEKEQLEAQLQQAQKMEAVGTLAGGVAHEFNNMLAIIMGNNELIMKEVGEGSSARESVEEIRLAGLRAKDVVKQLLTFSRQDDVVQKPMDLTAVIGESIKLIRSSIPANIKIEQQLLPETYPVIGNETQINQLLINLCNNAVDALPENGGIITLELSNETIETRQVRQQTILNPGHYAKIKVSDNGHGMDSEVLKRIFEPYFTTKKFGEGTGIGMAIAHGIVERHDGEIIVESTPYQGSDFTIFFPAHDGMVVHEIDSQEVLAGGEESILYVDDEPSLAKLGERLLTSLGYSTLSTTDPEEALDLVKKQPQKFDLLITDMAMPNMTGDRLMIEVTKIRPDMPTIICTGYSSKISEKGAADIGASSYILKPISKPELAKLVRKVLDEAHSTDLCLS